MFLLKFNIACLYSDKVHDKSCSGLEKSSKVELCVGGKLINLIISWFDETVGWRSWETSMQIRLACMTYMLSQLNWQSFEERRANTIVPMFNNGVRWNIVESKNLNSFPFQPHPNHRKKSLDMYQLLLYRKQINKLLRATNPKWHISWLPCNNCHWYIFLYFLIECSS